MHQADLHRASTILRSKVELFEPADEDAFNVYTEYRPRFRFRDKNATHVVLFPDERSGCGGVVDNIVPQSLHQQYSEYSLKLLHLSEFF